MSEPPSTVVHYRRKPSLQSRRVLAYRSQISYTGCPVQGYPEVLPDRGTSLIREPRPPRILQWDYAQGPMAVAEVGAVSYERSTPVCFCCDPLHRMAGCNSQGGSAILIWQKVFMNSFCKSQFPQKSINLFCMLVIMKDKSTDLWGRCLLQNDSINTFYEVNSAEQAPVPACFGSPNNLKDPKDLRV